MNGVKGNYVDGIEFDDGINHGQTFGWNLCIVWGIKWCVYPRGIYLRFKVDMYLFF